MDLEELIDVVRKSEVKKYDFLDILVSIPSIDKISFIDDTKEHIEDEELIEFDTIGDEGFGEELEDEGTLGSISSKVEESGGSSSDGLFNDDSDDEANRKAALDKSSKFVKIAGKKSSTTAADEQGLDLLAEKPDELPDIEAFEVHEPEEDEENEQTIVQMMDDIILRTVTAAELAAPTNRLRARLDKKEIIAEVLNKISEFAQEEALQKFLTHKVVQYFKRKREMRALKPEEPEKLFQESARLYENLQILDEVLAKENISREVIEQKIANLEKEIEEKIEESKTMENELEQLIKITFIPNFTEKKKVEPEPEPNDDENESGNVAKKAATKEKPEKPENRSLLLINYLLRKMAEARNEISKLRFVLLRHQHTTTALAEESAKLEDLGNGLNMADYEHLQTEAGSLAKKIEERGADLAKLETTFKKQTNMLAHVREKRKILTSFVDQQEEYLNELILEKQSCRENLHALEVYRAGVLTKINNLRYEGGIVDKPDLLRDYDTTMELVTKMEIRVAKLKMEQIHITKKMGLISRAMDSDM